MMHETRNPHIKPSKEDRIEVDARLSRGNQWGEVPFGKPKCMSGMSKVKPGIIQEFGSISNSGGFILHSKKSSGVFSLLAF